MGVARRLCESASPPVYLTGLSTESGSFSLEPVENCDEIGHWFRADRGATIARTIRCRRFIVNRTVAIVQNSRSWRSCCLEPQCTQPTKQATDKPLTVVGALAWHQGLLLLTGPNAPGLVAKSISIDSAHNEDDRKSEWSGRAYEDAHRSLAP